MRPLTPRELQILERLKQGEPNKIIAYHLGISVCTVKVHMRHLMHKTRRTNRTALALLDMAEVQPPIPEAAE